MWPHYSKIAFGLNVGSTFVVELQLTYISLRRYLLAKTVSLTAAFLKKLAQKYNNQLPSDRTIVVFMYTVTLIQTTMNFTKAKKVFKNYSWLVLKRSGLFLIDFQTDMKQRWGGGTHNWRPFQVQGLSSTSRTMQCSLQPYMFVRSVLHWTNDCMDDFWQ